MINLACGVDQEAKIAWLIAAVLMCCAANAGAEEAEADARSEGWGRQVLIGIAAAPAYLGDDQLQGTALPDIRLEFADRFRASLLSGAELRLFRNGRWSVGPTLRYDFGRDERKGNPLVLFGSDTEDLRGLGDVEGAFEAGGYLSYDGLRWKSSLEVRKGLNGGHEGVVGLFDLKYAGEYSFLGRRAFIEIGPELLYGDRRYSQAYFGITAEQAENSGLSRYAANSGIVRFGIHADLQVPLNPKTSIGAFARLDRLGPTAADSPLVIERGSKSQFVSGVFIAREF